MAIVHFCSLCILLDFSIVLYIRSLSEVYSKRFDSGMNEVRTPGVQAGFQMALLGSTLVISIGGGLIAGEPFTCVFCDAYTFVFLFHPSFVHICFVLLYSL